MSLQETFLVPLLTVVVAGAIVIVIVASAARSFIVLLAAVVAGMWIFHTLEVVVLAWWRFLNPDSSSSKSSLWSNQQNFLTAWWRICLSLCWSCQSLCRSWVESFGTGWEPYVFHCLVHCSLNNGIDLLDCILYHFLDFSVNILQSSVYWIVRVPWALGWL